jgi:hypothetical protein
LFERFVDQIASDIEFNEALFGPALRSAIEASGGLSFSAIKAAQHAIRSTASLTAACVAAIKRETRPTMFVHCEKEELDPSRSVASDGLPIPSSVPATVRVIRQFFSSSRDAQAFGIRKGMEVPADSALRKSMRTNRSICSREDQGIWTHSRSGIEVIIRTLPVRHGVFGLISLAD